MAQAVQLYLTVHFGNPSSAHAYANAPAEALRTARRQVAGLIGADPAGIVFTGSGSAANNLAIRGAVLASPTDRPHLITQASEHPAVLAACRALQRLQEPSNERLGPAFDTATRPQWRGGLST